MATTLSDYGRNSEKHGEIAYYYAFPIRFYFGQHQIAPDDVHSWARENCQGYYKISCYSHESSKRDIITGEVTERVVFVDKIYLSDEADALAIKLIFDVRDQKIMRPKLARKNRKKDRAVSSY